ncbi:MAG TPA: hypothetical protein VI300_06190 [Solirubrobacter sp.]
MRRLAPALYALAAAALVAAVVFALTRGDDAKVEPVPPARTPLAKATPAPTPPPAGKGLAVGVTEFNANLIASPEAKAVPEPWNAVRDKLGAIKPAYFRLVIDWASIQPSAETPANLDSAQGGCMREVGPCLGWGGVREQLRALASRQREGGWTALVVFTGTPEWAASSASGCERPQAAPRSRQPRTDALPAYQRLVRDVIKAAGEEGARLTFFSPWNEPNHPAFISPQRAQCDPSSPSTAPAAYAQIAQAMRQALDAAPGEQQLVLGETAGLMKSTRYVTSVPDFIAGLPKDLVCSTTVWSQHAYIGGDDPIEQADAALKAFGCPHPFTFWITETGVGPAPEDLSAGGSIADAAAGCAALHAQLVRWYEDPRVTIAFQYTVREDDKFPVGLVSTDMTTDRPALKEWTAWGGSRKPADPPPASTC